MQILSKSVAGALFAVSLLDKSLILICFLLGCSLNTETAQCAMREIQADSCRSACSSCMPCGNRPVPKPQKSMKFCYSGVLPGENSAVGTAGCHANKDNTQYTLFKPTSTDQINIDNNCNKVIHKYNLSESEIYRVEPEPFSVHPDVTTTVLRC